MIKKIEILNFNKKYKYFNFCIKIDNFNYFITSLNKIKYSSDFKTLLLLENDINNFSENDIKELLGLFNKNLDSYLTL